MVIRQFFYRWWEARPRYFFLLRSVLQPVLKPARHATLFSPRPYTLYHSPPKRAGGGDSRPHPRRYSGLRREQRPVMLSIVAKATQPDLLARAIGTQRPQLVTIPYSNFCELGRWSLAACGPYDEIASPPGVHVLQTLALRFGNGENHISTSSRMMPGKGGSPTGVPVCAMPDGTVLVDSWSILRASATKAGWIIEGLTPELQDLLDMKLGVYARTMAYRGLLKPANKNVFDWLLTFGEGWMWKISWACVGGSFGASLKKSMRIEDATHMSQVEDELIAGLRQLGEQLAALQTPFWGGATPGAADIAIAAILAPCVLPAGYCNGRFNAVWNQLLNQDEESRARVAAYRSTEIGKHIMHVYFVCGRGTDATPIQV